METTPYAFTGRPRPREPIVGCLCGSGLIRPTHARRREDRGWPNAGLDCERLEVMGTSPLVAAVWRHCEVRAADAMHGLADTLREQR